MVISASISDRIVKNALEHLGQPFDYEGFNCVHFVRKVYASVGIKLPLLDRTNVPPGEFNVSEGEFIRMPLGHCAFFKRKDCISSRPWTHIALIFSRYELIHCSRRFGGRVVVTTKPKFLKVYALVPKPL